jgi:hypothetical protein
LVRGSAEEFTPVEIGSAVAAFLIGAEIFMSDAVVQYARDGVTLLLAPRSTSRIESDRWLDAARRAAKRGHFPLMSSNRAPDGAGWIIDSGGRLLAATDEAEPFITLDLKLPASPETVGFESESPVSG